MAFTPRVWGPAGEHGGNGELQASEGTLTSPDLNTDLGSPFLFKQGLSTWVRALHRHWQWLEMLQPVRKGVNPGISWEQVREAAKHPTVDRVAVMAQI